MARGNIRSLYWKCRDLMEQVGRGGRKVAFLAMSVLEQTFTRALPLLLVRVEDIANGDMSQVEAVLRLRQIFKEDPYKGMWLERAGKYRELIESLGSSVRTTDYADLTTSMDPLLDAFTFYAGRLHYLPPAIHKVRVGERSMERPKIGGSVCRYSSEKELVDAVAGCGSQSVIVFGAVEETNRQKLNKTADLRPWKFDNLVKIAFQQKDVLSANMAWGGYLKRNRYVRHETEYRVEVFDFCFNHSRGIYVLGLDENTYICCKWVVFVIYYFYHG